MFHACSPIHTVFLFAGFSLHGFIALVSRQIKTSNNKFVLPRRHIRCAIDKHCLFLCMSLFLHVSLFACLSLCMSHSLHVTFLLSHLSLVRGNQSKQQQICICCDAILNSHSLSLTACLSAKSFALDPCKTATTLSKVHCALSRNLFAIDLTRIFLAKEEDS